MKIGIPGLLALVPLIIGPLPAEREDSLTVQLCGGGTISISLGKSDADTDPDAPPPCHAKACHAGIQRKKG